MRNEPTQDFAVVGVCDGKVVLEANEWDLSLGLYRTVTLYLSSQYAQEIADQLVICSGGTDLDCAATH